jgi:hypothetical protein
VSCMIVSDNEVELVGARVSSWKIEARNLKEKRGNGQREDARKDTYLAR